MSIHSLFFIVALAVAAASPAVAAEQMINLPSAPPAPASLAPGILVELPDGRHATIREVLPDGNFITEDGIIILPDGAISGASPAQLVRPVPGTAEEKSSNAAQARELLEQSAAGEEPAKEPDRPDQAAVTAPEPPDGEKPPAKAEKQQDKITLAGLLPLTTIEDRPAHERPGKPGSEAKKPAAAHRQEKKKPDHAAQKPAQRPKPGEALRIPPEAVATGSLDFLEGCWQGTRPEYYSKRTIRECFCFGPGGRNGKRRIIDRASGGRMCIGAATATLSGAGVLSVTSGRAPCTDGERWGQAEMVCRGQGAKTPCSWVFQDANGGRQAYEIPLIRVESCGR